MPATKTSSKIASKTSKTSAPISKAAKATTKAASTKQLKKASASVQEKAAKVAPVTSKKTEKAPQVEVATSVPAPAPTEPAPSPVIAQLDTIQGEITGLVSKIRGLTQNLKQVQKAYTKERRALERLHQKKKKVSKASGIKHQSGIAKPGFISPELCDFIGVNKGTEMARTEVSKYLSKYIKDHQLQDQNNKKVIVPDKKLKSLLQPKDGDEITYFNLQIYMKPHYVNPKKTASVSSASA